MFFKKRFKTWKTIALGTGLKTGADFRRLLNSAEYKIGTHGTDAILDHPLFEVAPRLIWVRLVNVSVRELGFYRVQGSIDDIRDATMVDIYKRAKEYGLGICPIEVGPQLRLQYPDQPPPTEMGDQYLRIGMYPVGLRPEQCYESDEYNPFILDVMHHPRGGLYLGATPARPLKLVYHDCRFIFMQRNQNIAR